MEELSAGAINNGLNSIFSPTVKILDLQNFVKYSPLHEKFAISNSWNIEQICAELEQLLKIGSLTFDEVTCLFVAVTLVFLCETRRYRNIRKKLLHRTFCFMDILSPVELHLATKRMFESLKSILGEHSNTNVLKVCHHLFSISTTGYAMTLTLLWAMLHEIAGIKVEMYRLYELGYLVKILNSMDYKDLKKEENAPQALTLSDIVEFLINGIVFKPNEELLQAGYRKYYSYTLDDLKKLHLWANSAFVPVHVIANKTNNNWKIWMLVKERVAVSIDAMLCWKISELKDSS